MDTLYICYFTLGLATATFAVCSLHFFLQPNITSLKRMSAFTLALFSLMCVKDFIGYYFLYAFSDLSTIHIISVLDIPFIVTNCYFVCREMLQPGWLQAKRLFLHISAFIAIALPYMVYPCPATLYLLYGVAICYVVVAIILVAVLRSRFIRLLDNELSDNIANIKRLNATLALYSIYFLIGIPTYLLQGQWANIAWYAASSVIWMVLTVLIENHNVPDEVVSDINESIRPCDERPADSCADLSDKLTLLFEEKKLHRNPKLTLSDVAAEIGTNRTYISSFLNNELNVTFIEYVNRYRMEDAVTLLRESSNTHDTIAHIVGYGSPSTFYRVFKKTFGCTPNEFLDKKQD
ncbi:MAG: helix-turn-helix transcriptional regulator [Bacteroidales bacterium]|nr:helix-turn-helix transcriptional regulator [Bacteroidales bacterium]